MYLIRATDKLNTFLKAQWGPNKISTMYEEIFNEYLDDLALGEYEKSKKLLRLSLIAYSMISLFCIGFISKYLNHDVLRDFSLIYCNLFCGALLFLESTQEMKSSLMKLKKLFFIYLIVLTLLILIGFSAQYIFVKDPFISYILNLLLNRGLFWVFNGVILFIFFSWFILIFISRIIGDIMVWVLRGIILQCKKGHDPRKLAIIALDVIPSTLVLLFGFIQKFPYKAFKTVFIWLM